MKRLMWAMLAALMLTACGGGEEKDNSRLSSQLWGEIIVGVEFRPAPLRPGMNEFIVLATYPDRRAAHDMIVSLRSDPDDAWQQAIQDGNIGAYRRAVRLVAGPQILYVHLRRGLDETVLEYPLQVN